MVRPIFCFIILLLVVVTIASCTPQAPAALPAPETQQPLPDEGTAVPAVSATPEAIPAKPEALIPSQAYVDSAALAEPARVGAPWTLEVSGSLADGCTRISEVRQSWSGDILLVEIVAVRPSGLACTQALVPFTRQVVLDTAGVPDGGYTVSVGDQRLPLVIGTRATPTARASKPVGDLLIRPAVVEDAEVIQSAGSAEVRVMVSGYYPDGCTRFHGTTQMVDGMRIVLTVETERPRDAMCTMAIVPYTETVAVDVNGLAPGAYTLEVNGRTLELSLP